MYTPHYEVVSLGLLDRALPMHLEEGELHIWHIETDRVFPSAVGLRNLLTSDEEVRAARFYSERERSRYVAARSFLRAVLGLYLGVDPKDLQFHHGRHGKPALAGHSVCQSLNFNVSHSNGTAAFALSRQGRVGIDLELVKTVPELPDIIRRFFTAKECEVIDGLSAEEKLEAFFRVWTGQEAYLKATGEGISDSLAEIEISIKPGEPARLLSIEGDIQEATRWQLETFNPSSNHIASVVLECQPSKIRFFTVDGP